MVKKNKHIAPISVVMNNNRQRLSKLKVLVADRDNRTASLVQGILFSFGFRNMDVVTSGESALTLLRSRPYDIIITEWNMVPVDGVRLVKAIRRAKDDARIPRDIPIIMLTARADKESIYMARDAGITEFVAKPFSAKAISNRIIQIIDNPRAFVENDSYVGPCRRRLGEPPPGVEDRRVLSSTTLPPSQNLQEQLGEMRAADILTEAAVEQAQADLEEAESTFIDWAFADIKLLEQAYTTLVHKPNDEAAARALSEAAYAIKSQAGIFGYSLGTEVATLLVGYLETPRDFTKDNLVVLRKHIDAIHVIFKQKIKQHGQHIGRNMMLALKTLAEKLG
jgi:CheY-like chemotaxis protein